MNKNKIAVLTGSGEAFNGGVSGVPESSDKSSFSLGKRCPQCSVPVPDKPSNKSYCNNRCRDDFFNNLKKEERQKLEKLKLMTDIQQEENHLQEVRSKSQEIIRKKEEMMMHLKALEVPPEGKKVDVNYLNQIDFEIQYYDNLIASKKYPRKHIAEYGDFGLFWIDTYEILIINKNDYLLWEL